jgi:hypothetical protein
LRLKIALVLGVDLVARPNDRANIPASLNPRIEVEWSLPQQATKKELRVHLYSEFLARVILAQFGSVNVDMHNLSVRNEAIPVKAGLLETEPAADSEHQVGGLQEHVRIPHTPRVGSSEPHGPITRVTICAIPRREDRYAQPVQFGLNRTRDVVINSTTKEQSRPPRTRQQLECHYQLLIEFGRGSETLRAWEA